jgi:hypothetical protein
MEPSRDEILFATLESLRPPPSPAFAAELDARAAAGFPRPSAAATSPLARLAARARAVRPRQLVFAGGAAALATVAIATVVVVSGNRSSGTDSEVAVTSAGLAESAAPRHPAAKPAHLNEFSEEVPTAEAAESSASAGVEAESPAGLEQEARTVAPGSGPYASQAHHRDVEYAAEMVLGTKPEAVGDAAGKVFDTLHQYGGIVLDSSVRGGSEDGAGAEFELLIPSAKLGDALAAFSGIAEVHSRHETSNDITAPTVTTSELLQDSHARVESLLNQLADTETEVERDAVEAQLRGERRHAARLQASLTNLQRRASFSHVSLRIESGGSHSSSGGGWDLGDAFHDAGQVLTVGAGVAIVALAVLAPIALIALLFWLANRAWVRQRRERALG